MDLFLSTYTNKIDKKGRVSVPASYRAILAKKDMFGIVAYVSLMHDCITAGGVDHITKISQKIENMEDFSDEHHAFAMSILGGCVQLSFDADGRILLPSKLIEVAGITDKAVFVGTGNTFEIWGDKNFDDNAQNSLKYARENRKAISVRNGAIDG